MVWGYGVPFVSIVALSTAVAIKMLGQPGAYYGASIGILIAQDLAFVPMIIIVQSLGGRAIMGLF